MPKYLDTTSLKELMTLVKGYVDENVRQKMDAFTLGEGLSLENSILSVTIDTDLFKVVEELPTTPAASDANKIFLVLDDSNVEGNYYVEYLYTDSGWEELGRQQVEVDLEPYLKSENLTATLSSTSVSLQKNGETLYTQIFASNDFQTTVGTKSINIALKAILSEAVTSGMYKFSVDTKGRVTAVTAIQLSDLTALGVAKQTDVTALEDSLNTEISNRETAISGVEQLIEDTQTSLEAKITSEEAARISADSTLTTNLASEVSRATAAEETLTTNLASEAATARAAESANASNITTLQSGLNTLEETVEGLSSSKVSSVTLTKVSDLEYTLTVDGTDYTIDIPKDQFIKDVTYEDNNLVFTFETTTGESTVKVDISDLIDTYTNSDGSLSISGYVINHSNTITAGTTASTATGTLSHGGSFVVPTVTYDKNGHITATGSTTQTLPSETTLSKGTDATATKTLTHGGTFTAYTSLAVSNHTVTPTVTTFTMPSQVTLSELSGISTITATGDENLTLTATKSGTSVTITGSVAVMTEDEVTTLYNEIYS